LLREWYISRSDGVQVATIYRWVLRFTPLLADAARPCRHRVGDRWQVDETYVKVAGHWRYVYRAIDQFGQVIDVFVASRRETKAAQRFCQRAIGTTKTTPAEVTTDRAPVYPAVLEDLLPAAWHRTDQYANNRVECDHGRLKARLRPMRLDRPDGLLRSEAARARIRRERGLRIPGMVWVGHAIAIGDFSCWRPCRARPSGQPTGSKAQGWLMRQPLAGPMQQRSGIIVGVLHWQCSMSRFLRQYCSHNIAV
jgi:transposase-like protein